VVGESSSSAVAGRAERRRGLGCVARLAVEYGLGVGGGLGGGGRCCCCCCCCGRRLPPLSGGGGG
jgi:hypothetical protein